MLEPQVQPQNVQFRESVAQNVGSGTPSKVLKMIKNERMGGYVPSWETADTPSTHVEQRLSQAVRGEDNTSFKAALAYHEGAQITEPGYGATRGRPFEFGDLVDMVNPLHHIPVVGDAYREITGDDIRPIGRIIGGAVFGGPAGAAMGTINVALEEETGRDLAGNAMAVITREELDVPAHTAVESRERLYASGSGSVNSEDLLSHTPDDHPEVKINKALRDIGQPYRDMPGALLAFTDLGAQPQGFEVRRLSGAPKTYADIRIERDAPKEAITEVDVKPFKTASRAPRYND